MLVLTSIIKSNCESTVASKRISPAQRFAGQHAEAAAALRSLSVGELLGAVCASVCLRYWAARNPDPVGPLKGALTGLLKGPKGNQLKGSVGALLKGQLKE